MASAELLIKTWCLQQRCVSPIFCFTILKMTQCTLVGCTFSVQLTGKHPDNELSSLQRLNEHRGKEKQTHLLTDMFLLSTTCLCVIDVTLCMKWDALYIPELCYPFSWQNNIPAYFLHQTCNSSVLILHYCANNKQSNISAANWNGECFNSKQINGDSKGTAELWGNIFLCFQCLQTFKMLINLYISCVQSAHFSPQM